MDKSSTINTHHKEEEHVPTKALSESPVLNALRSHIEKWYPEAKNNRLEVEDVLDLPESA